jgi:hypothetical protein
MRFPLANFPGRRALPVCVAALVWTSVLCAQESAEPGTDPYRDFTPAQIAALPESVRLDEVPIQYIFAAQGYEDPEGFRLVHSMKLQALMYDTSESFEAAVRDFQRDLEHEPTGILTVGQIAELTYRNGLLKLGRVEMLNAVKAYSLRDDAATAQGTWTAAPAATLIPINEVRISCDRERSVCEESTTYVIVPGRESWNMAFLVLNTSDSYTVSRWRRQGIEATRLAGCREILLSITRTGEVTRTPGELIPEDQCSLPVGSQAEAAADLLQTVVLANGSEIIHAEYQRLQALALSFLRRGFRDALERWRADAQAPTATQQP